MDNIQGIIVGCDRHHQWLLPWWWEHYSKHNSYPVLFADFGMTEGALAWCHTQGQVLSLPQTPWDDAPVTSHHKALWEDLYGDTVWSSRPSWFKKPLALTQSPFSQTLWLDLDCQVLGPLDPLFNALSLGFELALVREPAYVQNIERQQGLLLDGEVSYNSGVFAFTKETPILELWKQKALTESHLFIGDQNILSRVIFEKKTAVFELSDTYNWKDSYGPNPEAVIHHFLGQAGKQKLFCFLFGESKKEENF
jgi:Lipopolysaccharide biosynthesis proteins, LPS:glycosyltransferases